MKTLLTSILILTFQLCTFGQTIIPGGNISGTWYQSGSPYLIQGNVHVTDLIIEPGVDIIFEDNFEFIVQNSLIAIGSVTDSIRFTVSDTSGFYTNSHSGWTGFDTYFYEYSADFTLQYCIIEYCKNGVYMDGSLNISDCSIRNNSVGILVEWPNNSDDIFERLHVYNNRGNGLYFSSGNSGNSPLIKDCRVVNNEGYGIYSGFAVGATIDNCLVKNNTRGISAGLETGAYIVNSEIINNGSLALNGGGIYVSGSCSINNCTIKNNIAKSGGGISASLNFFEQVVINNCQIDSNFATHSGGGIYSAMGGFILKNSVVSNNSATFGGGIYALDANNYYSGNNQISNNLIYKNYAVEKGAGLFVRGSYGAEINQVTFIGNYAGVVGGGIFNDKIFSEPMSISNSILWNNSPDQAADSIDYMNITYTDIQGGWPGTGNINSNPLFKSPSTNDYSLTWANFPIIDYTHSPCIDAGDPASDPDPDGTLTDLGARFFDQSIQQPHYLDLKVYLEGPYNGFDMNSSLNGAGYLPLTSPYNGSPWYHPGLESVQSIPNSDIVDWLMIELRKYNDIYEENPICVKTRQAVFLMNDGSIKALDGNSLPQFYTDDADSLHAIVYHRNHLPVISADPLLFVANVASYDFTSSAQMAMDGIHCQNEISPGIWGMVSADGNANGQVDNSDKDESWSTENGMNGYLKGDFNLDTQVNQSDLSNYWEMNAGKGTSAALPENNYFEWNCNDLLVDYRDGHSYNTVLIGDQCWMAENLNYGTMINTSNDQSDNEIVEKYCYNNSEANCDIYGGIYQWSEIMGYVNNAGIQGICPADWHIPTDTEWCTLENYVDSGTVPCDASGYRGNDCGGNLKDTLDLWAPPNTGATNNYLFSALPGGYYDYNSLQIYGVGYYGQFFTSSFSSPDNPWTRSLEYNKSTIRRKSQSGEYGLSLRCVKD